MSNPNPSPETRFKPGESGNPGGRPKTPLKDFQREVFASMSNEEKKDFLKDIAKDVRWKMAEGNPEQPTDITSGGKELTPILVKFVNEREEEKD